MIVKRREGSKSRERRHFPVHRLKKANKAVLHKTQSSLTHQDPVLTLAIPTVQAKDVTSII